MKALEQTINKAIRCKYAQRYGALAFNLWNGNGTCRAQTRRGRPVIGKRQGESWGQKGQSQVLIARLTAWGVVEQRYWQRRFTD